MFRLLVSLLLSLACATALADPPVRVARLGYVRGPVSFSPAGTNDWAVASLNRPLIAGDRVWADPAGRDELQLGGARLRMDGNTLLSILTLDDRVLQVQLSQGTLNVRVRPGPAAGTIEVDTPNLAVTIDQPGHYRIGVDPAGDTTVVRVDDGQAQVMGQYQAYTVNPGQYLRFAGPDLRNVQALDPRYRDDFDRWAAARDQRADRALATRYVSPAMIGYDDLDDYGTWRTVPAYGHVWMPRGVQRGWAPYRDGHWAWIEPWGWTWIDDAPWGFAVTHYGRWANLDDGWAWVPEPANAMPVYAPALVVFAAIGDGLGRSSREPAVAWFPLAPREPYRPPYQASPRYVSAINYNIVNVTNNVYVNRQVNGAVTAVTASAFTRAEPVRRAAVAVARERVAAAPVLAAPQVQAQRESLANRLSAGHRPSAALLARPAMTHLSPAIAHAQPRAVSPAMHQNPEERRDRAMQPAAPPAALAHGPNAVPPGRADRVPPPAQRMDDRRANQPHPAPIPAPHPDLEAERRAMQAMHQPQRPVQGSMQPDAHAQVPPPGHAAPGRQDRVPAQAQVPPVHPEPQHADHGRMHVQPLSVPSQHPEPQRAERGPVRMQPPPALSHVEPQRFAREAPRPQPQRMQPQPEPQRAAHEPPRTQPAPRPEIQHPPHEQAHGQAQRAQFTPPPRPQPQQAPPHPEPQHPAPPQAQQPHPAAPQPEHKPEPPKGQEHGHGHKDDHH